MEISVTLNIIVIFSNNGQDFGGSVYHKVNSDLAVGVQLAWNNNSNATKLGLGASFNLDKDATVRAKVNNDSQIGLGYQQKLRDGVVLSLSSLVDGKNFNTGGHKIGIALELNA